MSVKKSRGLGRGLGSLIPEAPKQDNQEENKSEDIKEAVKKAETIVSIMKVEPNREQPRKYFEDDGIKELSESIKQHGIIQPLLVQDRGDYYQIIAGERRWRAAQMAGLTEIPVIIKNYTEQEIVEVSIIENIQREDLNPIEEALAYKRLFTEFNLKQEEIAERMSKNRATVSNSMRLLNLSEPVQEMLIEGRISAGHARTLLSVDNADKQLELAEKISKEKLSVREVEKLVKNLDKPVKEKKVTPEVLKLLCADIENNLRQKLNTKVVVAPKDEQRGKIEIEYYSREQMEYLVAALSKVEE